MIKKFTLAINANEWNWFILNEDMEKKAIAEIESILSENDIHHTPIKSVDDFESINDVLSKKFDDELNIDYFLDEYSKGEIYSDLLNILPEHDISEEALIACLKSVGWIE